MAIDPLEQFRDETSHGTASRESTWADPRPVVQPYLRSETTPGAPAGGA